VGKEGTVSAAEQIGRFVCETTFDEIPAYVREAACLHLLDTLGVGIAASALGTSTAGRAVACMEPTGASSIIGTSIRASAADAALANGMLCHALDFDDTHLGSVVHVGTVVVPAALAISQAVGATGRELLEAIVIGSEIAIRIGRAAGSAFLERGFHATGLCGAFGAVGAGAHLYGLDLPRVVNALGIAGSMASGIFEYLSDGSATKPIHAGWASHAGVVAAQLAMHGAEGPATVLEGRFGVFRTHGAGTSRLPVELDNLGRGWESPATMFKRFPACHLLHCALFAMASLVKEFRLSADSIEEVVVTLPDQAIPVVGEPRQSKVAPRTAYEAKFSAPYSLAALVVDSKLDLGAYLEEKIADPEILALAQRVRTEGRVFDAYPASYPGSVRVVTADGHSITRDETAEQPMSVSEVLAKFRANAGLGLDAEYTSALESRVMKLGSCPSADLIARTLEHAREWPTASPVAGQRHAETNYIASAGQP
jgi:2-methylcitrate dehydratase PrpD